MAGSNFQAPELPAFWACIGLSPHSTHAIAGVAASRTLPAYCPGQHPKLELLEIIFSIVRSRLAILPLNDPGFHRSSHALVAGLLESTLTQETAIRLDRCSIIAAFRLDHSSSNKASNQK
jgi:hypothetical protein